MQGFHVALVEPEIPENAGAAARLCVATGSTLHLVGRLGFQLTSRRIRRAGLDYWRHLDLRRHIDLDACQAELANSTVHCFSAHAASPYTDARFEPNALLVFGSETRGLAATIRERADRCWRIPIRDSRVRSLNLATSVAIALYEAIRQNQPVGR